MAATRTLLLSMVLLMATIKIVNSCSCYPEHPQVQACKADFVILARILSSRPTKDPLIPSAHYIGYRLKIQQIFKTNASVDEVLKYKFITTPKDESLCAPDLELKQLYLISGSVNNGRAYVTLCNFVKPWNHLSLVQRKGFRKNYYENCNCKVTVCWRKGGECEQPSVEGCGWTTNDGTEIKNCQSKHAVCTKRASGYCGWGENRYLTHCMSKTRGEQQRTVKHHRNNESLDP